MVLKKKVEKFCAKKKVNYGKERRKIVELLREKLEKMVGRVGCKVRLFSA